MTVVRNRRALFNLLEAPGGTTGRYTFLRGERVASRARQLLAGKVETGRLRNSIKTKPPQRIGLRKRGITVQVGSFGVQYAKWVHDGTGIYGPHGSPIVPRTAKFLRFTTKSGVVVFAKSVRGVPPYPYMQMALEQEMGR